MHNTCSIKGCERAYRAKGYCGTHYNQVLMPDRHITKITCDTCGAGHTTTRTNGRYCSLPCRDLAMREQEKGQYRERPPKPPKPKYDPRSPLRRAMEDGGDVIAAVKADCVVTPAGCWEWQRYLHRGYAQISIDNKQIQVHRLVLETKHGQPLGDQAAHHICANSRCVNPEHLQPVTHAENTAEMLARTYMIKRIQALEAALEGLDPAHELLREVGLPT